MKLGVRGGVVAAMLLIECAACVGDPPAPPAPQQERSDEEAGSKPEPVEAGAPDAIDAQAPETSVPEASVVVDKSCLDLKARTGATTDAVYTLDPDGEGPVKPMQIFCAGMGTPTPKEYLELKQLSTPSSVTSNYATYMAGSVHAAWTCDCGQVTLVYSKVKIDINTLTVEGGDRTFAVYATSTNVSCLNSKASCSQAAPQYGVAMSCNGNYDQTGKGNVDLRGTGFHIAGSDSSMFKKLEEFNPQWGYTSAGTAKIDALRKVLDLTGGGDCGGFGAIPLKLAQD